MCKLLIQHKWRFFFFFYCHHVSYNKNPCCPWTLPAFKKRHQFWKHTFQAQKSFCSKVSPVKAEELVTEPLFYSDNIQVGNKTILHRRWIEKGVCCISHLLHDHRAVLCLMEFNMKYGLNTDILTAVFRQERSISRVWILLSKVTTLQT